MRLTEEQIERYSRHIILPEVGGTGQEKLLDGKVLIVGVGGLGSPAALYLAAAGVGTIGLIDADAVELSNLQRQIIHATPDLGRPKVVSATEKMRAINPDVTLNVHPERLTAANAMALLKDYDFIIDGTDNFASKFLVADACHFALKPYSHAGVLRFAGQTMTVIPGKTACYRCIFSAPPPAGAAPSCSQAGVLGVLAGVVGCIQATEAIKFLLSIGDLLTNRLLVYNALNVKFRDVSLRRNLRCPLCGDHPSITELKDEAAPDDGAPVRNVPASFKNEGKDVLETMRLDDAHWQVDIRKKQ
jgi:molybdopterin-synthase adenylyltransferase